MKQTDKSRESNKEDERKEKNIVKISEKDRSRNRMGRRERETVIEDNIRINETRE